MSIEVEVVKESWSSLFLVAKQGNEKVGQQDFFPGEDGETLIDLLESFKPGIGVPRALIERAVIELQNLANKNGEIIHHEAIFTNDESENKLKPIYADNGYTPMGCGLRHYQREYNPE